MTRYTPEANTAIEALQALGFDFAEADMIYHGDMLGAKLGVKVAERLAALQRERDALRDALVNVRDGLRSDGRVWLPVPPELDGEGDWRQAGPGLRDYIDAAISNRFAIGGGRCP
jgi:hypothetical protein